jgi:hypothetical protein
MSEVLKLGHMLLDKELFIFGKVIMSHLFSHDTMKRGVVK